jgi:hypothetical protein
MVTFGGKLRTLTIASALLGLATAQASACAIGHSDNVFFDHVPEGVDGFVVLEATLVESHSLIDKTQAWTLMGRARIDRVINGKIDGKTVKLFRYIGDPCGVDASGKTRGIVIGNIREGTQNELEVLTEFQWNARAQASLATLRTLAIVSALFAVAPVQTSACPAPNPENIFFDTVPSDIDGFVVLEVTLVDRKPQAQDKMLYLGVARIDRVINGKVDGNTVKLYPTVWTSCGFGPQQHGIVVGTMHQENELEVMSPDQWRQYQYRARLRANEESNEWRGRERAPWQEEWQGPEWVPWPGLSRPSTPQQ